MSNTRQWVAFCNIDALAARVTAGGIPLVVMVQTAQQAVHAAELGADAVVAQVGHHAVRTTSSTIEQQYRSGPCLVEISSGSS